MKSGPTMGAKLFTHKAHTYEIELSQSVNCGFLYNRGACLSLDPVLAVEFKLVMTEELVTIGDLICY